MSVTLKIFKPALDDLQNALDWYAAQSSGLEKRFHKAVDEQIKFIITYPEASSFRLEGFRGRLLKKFPYMIYYDFDSTQNMVFVVAILHTKRDKKILKERKN